MTKDKWKNFWKGTSDPSSEAVKAYILDKYETHIMSRIGLQKSVQSSLSQFNEDVKASRNLLLAEMKVPLTTTDVKLDFPAPDFDTFQREYDDFVVSKVPDAGTSSVDNAILSLVLNTAGTSAAEGLFAQLLSVLAGEAVAETAAEAAVGGSATAGGAAVGGGAGWLGGPAGAAIGVGVGVAVGGVVDWWLTKSFKAKMTEQQTTYLTNLEHEMIDGSNDKSRPGLRSMLHTTVDKLDLIQSEAVLKALGGTK